VLPIAVEVSLDQHGTRTIQSIVEQLHKFVTEQDSMQSELEAVIAKLAPETRRLCTDVHGNHVIQTFIVRFRATDSPREPDAQGTEKLGKFTDFIYRACSVWALEIGTHKQGCCVM
jgi:hypothetical protein